MNRINALLAGGLGVLGAAWFASRHETGDEAEAGAWTIHDLPLLGEAVGLVDDVIGAATNPDLQSMRSSFALREMLKKSEGRCLLERTNLGDGGWTIGWGRFEKSMSALPPSITREQAQQMFDYDVDRRAERWVRAYVTVPLTQEQFDALTSMAYNLSPPSFRKIAEAVNRGESPDAAAMQYVRAGSIFERGLRNRRSRELALYHQGVYA